MSYEKLEERLLDFTGAKSDKHIVACNSGTAALHLALESIYSHIPVKLRANKYIAVPDYCMYAVPRSVVMAGFKPLFIDCNLNDYNMSLPALKQAYFNLRGDIFGTIIVHNYGRELNTTLFHEEFESTMGGLPLNLIEDMAECHGSYPDIRSKAATWSFYKNKIVHGEEGGCVTFSQEHCADYAKSLRSIGFTKEHNYIHNPRGHNYRLADSLANLIIGSLNNFNQSMKNRREMESIYDKLFKDINDIVLLRRDSPWVYDIRIPKQTKQQQILLVNSLQKICAGVRYGFKRNSTQLEFIPDFVYTEKDTYTPNSSKLETEIISLPLTVGGINGRETLAKQLFSIIKQALEYSTSK